MRYAVCDGAVRAAADAAEVAELEIGAVGAVLETGRVASVRGAAEAAVDEEIGVFEEVMLEAGRASVRGAEEIGVEGFGSRSDAGRISERGVEMGVVGGFGFVAGIEVGAGFGASGRGASTGADLAFKLRRFIRGFSGTGSTKLSSPGELWGVGREEERGVSDMTSEK